MSESAILIGAESVTMFSLRHLHTGLWLNIGDDGGIRLDSPEPIYLGRFYNEPDAHTEAFAYQYLAWLTTNAVDHTVVDGRWTDIDPVELGYTSVCRFTGSRPLLLALAAGQ